MKLTKVLMGAILLRIASVVFTFGLMNLEPELPLGAVLSVLMLQQGIFFWPRVIMGILAPIVLAVMIHSTVRIHHTQAATGLLYVAVVPAVCREAAVLRSDQPRIAAFPIRAIDG
jgi:hypothetical protein